MKRITHFVILGLIGLPLSLMAGTTTPITPRDALMRMLWNPERSPAYGAYATQPPHGHIETASLTTSRSRGRRRASLKVHRYYERFTESSFTDTD